MVNATGDVTDTFQNVTRVFVGDGAVVADQLRFMLEQQPHPFVQLWDDLLARVRSQAEAYEPAYSEMAVVKYFESQLSLRSHTRKARTVIAKPHSQSENCQFITPTALPFVWRISMPRILCGAIAASTASRARSVRRQASPA